MFTKSKDHNINYLASIVRIDSFRSHPNADKLKLATIQGNVIITGINAQPGLYCYFPLECAISKEFLSYSNSYRDPELNTDKSLKGMFEAQSRIKAISLRGQKSEGYIIPVSSLESFIKDVLGKIVVIDETYEGTDFDTILDHQLCRKYIPLGQRNPNNTSKKTRGNVKKYQSKLVENQFRFFPDTSHLKREVGKISPDDYVAITSKLHGCNFTVANVIIKKAVSIKDRIAKFFGVNIQDTEYNMLYASRAVLKNLAMDDGKVNNHYYDTDIWKIVADKVYPSLPKGVSVSGEIVGYTPTGKYIQPQYDYGCSPGNLDFYIFRVSFTNHDGKEYVFSHRETVEFCNKFGFKMPETFYYGKAKDHFPELDTEIHWHDNFLQKMIATYLEKKCKICKNDVPDEGIILRTDTPFEWHAFKLKSHNFLMRESAELDKGEIDMETQETIANETVTE